MSTIGTGRLVAACVAVGLLIVGGAVVVRMLRDEPGGSGTTSAAIPPGASVAEPVRVVVDGPVQINVSTGARVCPSLRYVKQTEAQVRERAKHARPGDVQTFFGELYPQEVNAPMQVAVYGEGDLPVRITGLAVDVVRAEPDQAQHGIYLIFDPVCDYLVPGEPMPGDAPDTLVPNVYARFGGDRVALGNYQTFVAAPTEHVSELVLRPQGCGGQVTDFIVTVDWAAGDRTGRSVFGPFRSLPQQDLPEFKLGQREFKAPPTLTRLTGGREVRPCRSGPVPDPQQPQAAPYCGSVPVDGPGGSVYVRIAKGIVDCGKARELIDTYLNHPPTQPQGSGHFVALDDWECTSQGWVYKAVSAVGGDCSTKESSVEFSAL
ncbi:hypothetical protein [Catellatospora tritici]|uniref:hypothetical protein n=1 Tax=Catellatospora tritici TaxID=2851566 RepID=UPI001C2DB61B|nr:hypothetical protein [Catellatospora tritici]MBV1850121.1 hypothetical protein [Catellatospora tritici]